MAIAESKNVEKIKLEELLGSLQTYELDPKVPNKKKGLALLHIKKKMRIVRKTVMMMLHICLKNSTDS